MRFYNATRFIFPRHYGVRIFATCFLAVHIPLITYGGMAAIRAEIDWGIAIALLAATVAGSIFGIAALAGLLMPLRIATLRLQQLQQGQKVANVPTGGADMAGELLSSVALAVDATVSQLDRLREAALTDTLTGLRNRRGFEASVDQALIGGRSGTLALLDGDRFKQVNDRLGHAEGDKVLRGFARRIAEFLRATDISGRWGGDEFVVFFPGLDAGEASRVIERIRDALIERPDAVIDGNPVTFTYGLAPLEKRGKQALETAMDIADTHLYAVKETRAAAIVAAA
ncbi:GGDEF domain-containing protein [Croceicoccus mobilis]|uniref:diguanylate cyclase n=1 Tax=Croceicoccus mobilis TaxID=1703339 RepID=A0A916Z6L6_9SPHN|nr:GGDEF domain-containing protein [Croceicoccus mobilis]GGD78469.1 transcriptional regulator [Croceicoccus mobilis]